MNIQKAIRHLATYQGSHTQAPEDAIIDIVSFLEPKYICKGLQFIGGEGIVIKISRKNVDYALKIMLPALGKGKELISGFEFFKKKIIYEGTGKQRFLLGIEEQKNLYESLKLENPFGFGIPKVHKVFDPDVEKLENPKYENYPTYYIMDWVHGEQMRVHLSTLKHSEALKIFLVLVKGVKFMHHCGTVHRDLKTGNLLPYREKVWINGKQQYVNGVSLIDWNISKPQGDRNLTKAKVQMGTVPYANARISINGFSKDYSFADDVHSLGLIFWEFATRERLPVIPKNRENDIAYREKYRLERFKKLSLENQVIFNRSTTPDLKERYHYIEEMIGDIERQIEKEIEEETYLIGFNSLEDVYNRYLDESDDKISYLVREQVVNLFRRVEKYKELKK